MSSRKLDIPKEHIMQKYADGMDLQKQKILIRGSKNTQKNYTKKTLLTEIIMML